ncbi:TetR/AcrR family transcriptional regulator [Streptomyces sp. MP131-18]|uniref:TetR/AcrR family transcriptional regulator n=1 Tax=Streptomyces sp. MP131-18 TaxID=1857892 RepID=UPI0009D1E8C0|nr:TetR/AcrR family transcriptional regulator [Streptomyces sp. MP131-18]ONK15538.1 Tetracycline repressor protein class H [Streptomyces sp. MP131-18]
MEIITGKPQEDDAAPTCGGRSVWLRPPPATRNGPPLTRERITEAAVALLDEEGIERLTMRHLAERLQVGATTLYWHIDTKDDVIDLAVDAIFAEAAVPGERAGSWRDDVVALLTGCRATLLKHPWSAALPLRQRPVIGPNFLMWMEYLQATLVRAGLTGRHVQAACWLLYSHVQGSTASQSNLRWTDAERHAAHEQLGRHSHRYPTLLDHSYVLDDEWDENFRLGLTYVLDGLEAQIRSAS